MLAFNYFCENSVHCCTTLITLCPSLPQGLKALKQLASLTLAMGNGRLDLYNST